MDDKSLIRSSGGILIRKSNNIFYAALLYKNKSWVLPKGRIEIGESQRRAAIREISEETGILPQNLRVIKKIGQINYIATQKVDNFRPRPKIVSYFLIQTAEKKIRPLRKDGFQKARWFEIEDAFKKATFPESKGIILRAIKFLKPIKNRKIDTIVITVGGEGERMNFLEHPKLLLPIEKQAFLKYLIDVVILGKFEKIYLLTGHYHQKIKNFIERFYKKNPKIQIIYGGKKGIVKAVNRTKNLVESPFIYLDGNIIFEPNLLKNLQNQYYPKQPVVQMVLSDSNKAPTHLHVKVKGKNIIQTVPRLLEQNASKKLNFLCSMGIFIFDNKIFDLCPDFQDYYDLDILIDYFFKARSDVDLDFIKYRGEWYTLHTSDDYYEMRTKGQKFFKKLLNFNKFR